jgi:predicted nucleic acid-binding protein
MARTGNIVEHDIAPTVVQDAIVQIMRNALGNRPVDMDMARDMAGRLTPAVQKMGIRGASSATLSGNAAFHSLVAQHLGSPAAAVAYDPAFRKQMQQAIDTANIHGPHYLGGVVDGIRLARAMADARATDADGRRSGSSAKYAEAGMAVPGNADARGIDIRNYYTSPVTRSLVDMGMAGKTFDYVRQHVPGVSTNNIRNAARDARAMGFDVNDQRMVKNHAIIRHKDKEADKTNKHLQDFGKALDESKEFREAALSLKNAKSEEERKQALSRIKEISDGLAKKNGVTDDMARQREKAVSKAIGEIKDQKVEDKLKQIHGAAPSQRTAAERQDPKSLANADALLQAADAELASAKSGPTTGGPPGAAPAKANPDAGKGGGTTVAPKASSAPAPKQ